MVARTQRGHVITRSQIHHSSWWSSSHSSGCMYYYIPIYTYYMVVWCYLVTTCWWMSSGDVIFWSQGWCNLRYRGAKRCWKWCNPGFTPTHLTPGSWWWSHTPSEASLRWLGTGYLNGGYQNSIGTVVELARWLSYNQYTRARVLGMVYMWLPPTTCHLLVPPT